MKLIIAEKPSMALEIVKAIGTMEKHDGYYENKEYLVTFAYGHLLVLQDVDDYFNRKKTRWNLEELPVIPEPFIFKLPEDKGIKKQFDIIESLLRRKDIKQIIAAGDADREGEVIINNIIYKVLGKETAQQYTYRLWLKSLSRDEIRQSLESIKPVTETENLYNEGLARTYMDWLYGINLTRYLTLAAGELLPVGRVLVPIVRKVYQRNQEIKNFLPRKYIEIECAIKKENTVIKTTVKDLEFEKGDGSIQKIIDELNSHKCIVSSKESKKVEKKRPKLFSLTTLQNFMASNYKMPLDKTLDAMQSLYEKSYVTYPRTNSEYLHSSEKENVKDLVEFYAKMFDDEFIQFRDEKMIFDDAKVESHSAILPTKKVPDFEKLSKNEREVYQSVQGRFLTAFYSKTAVVEETKVVFSIEEYRAELKGSSIIERGFYKYEPPNSEGKLIPVFNKGETVDAKFEALEKETTPPKKITMVDMNNYLKNPFKKNEIDNVSDDEEYRQMLKGIEIGTVATRDSIIKNAVKYEYLTENKTVLDITDKGISLCELLESLNIDMGADKTVETSILLKEIYRNEKSTEDVVDYTRKFLTAVKENNKTNIKSLRKEKKSIGVCPRCGKAVYEWQKNFTCDGGKECGFTMWKNDKFFENKGISLNAVMAEKLLKNGQLKVENLISQKTKKTYSALIKIVDTGEYVNYKIEFPDISKSKLSDSKNKFAARKKKD